MPRDRSQCKTVAINSERRWCTNLAHQPVSIIIFQEGMNYGKISQLCCCCRQRCTHTHAHTHMSNVTIVFVFIFMLIRTHTSLCSLCSEHRRKGNQNWTTGHVLGSLLRYTGAIAVQLLVVFIRKDSTFLEMDEAAWETASDPKQTDSRHTVEGPAIYCSKIRSFPKLFLKIYSRFSCPIYAVWHLFVNFRNIVQIRVMVTFKQQQLRSREVV